VYVEGERDVHTVEAHGRIGTTSSGGAKNFEPDIFEVFRDGGRVLVVADADSPGRQHARMVKAHLESIGAIVRYAEPASGHKDLTDHFDAGKGWDDLQYVEDPPAPDLGLVKFWDLIESPDPPYDWLIPGLLERGERFMLTGAEGGGKRLPLDTPVATPSGMAPLGALRVGDAVLDRDGKPCRVTALSEIEDVEAWRIRFTSGEHVLACAEHEWVARVPRQTTTGSKEVVLTTSQLAEALQRGSCSIPAAGPLDLPDADLPVDPYLLGVWLAAGSAGSSLLDLPMDHSADILQRLKHAGCEPAMQRQVGVIRARLLAQVPVLGEALAAAGLLDDPRVPGAYLRASLDQRLALVQGLMDAAAHRTEGGRRVRWSYRTDAGPRPALVSDVVALYATLGLTPYVRVIRTAVGVQWEICVSSDLPLFSVSTRPSLADNSRPLSHRHRILSVDPTGVLVPMRCISVDAPSRTYLITDRLIPTHNSVFLRQFAVQVAAGIHPFTGESIEPRRVLWVDAENSSRQNRRQFAPLAQVTVGHRRVLSDERFLFAFRPEGLDLAKDDDRAWFMERVFIARPDLLVIGPWYRLFIGPPSDEELARRVVATLDEARTRVGFTLMMEAHSPHSDGGRANRSDGVRPVRPLGSSLLLRWPEFGFGLSFRDPEDQNDGTSKWGLPDFSYADFIAWRGGRDEREWPEAFVRSGNPLKWPWRPANRRPVEVDYDSVVRSINRKKR
jgi:hypothetical protein